MADVAQQQKNESQPPTNIETGKQVTTNSALKSSFNSGMKDKGKRVVSFKPLVMQTAHGTVSQTAKNVEFTPQQPREGRRTVKPSDNLRSRYVIRCVDFNVSSDERNVHEWIMAAFGSDSDNSKANRAAIEGLAANTVVDRTVLDVWAAIMNYNERFRNRDSPRRYFFNTHVMGDVQFRNNSINMEKMYPWFVKNMNKATNNNIQAHKFKDIDLVFFPMIKHQDFYVVVFNLKVPSCTILDNTYAKPTDPDEMIKSYAYATDVLDMLMIKHLKEIGHPAWEGLGYECQDRPEMEWQTHNNFTDSGVFAMRIMETYMGDLRTWKPGFDANEKKQDSQLAILRMKYVSKIVLNNCNTRKAFVLQEMARYFTIEPNIRKGIVKNASITRWERLNPTPL